MRKLPHELARTEAFLANVAAFERSPARAQEARDQLSSGALGLLVRAAQHPGEFLVKLYKEVGLHPVQGKSSAEQLIARGLIKVHRLGREGRGARPMALEVLPRGLEELRQRGLEGAQRLLKRGGWKHDVYARWMVSWARGQSFQVWLERQLGPKAFDVVYEAKEELIGLEICLTGSVAWNVQQLEKAASVEGVSKVVAVSDDAALLEGLEKRFPTRKQGQLFECKVLCRHVGAYAPAELNRDSGAKAAPEESEERVSREGGEETP
jgi:hypothetical protein